MNPNLKVSALIYEAPFFGMHEAMGLHNPFRKLLMQTLAKMDGFDEKLFINPGMKPGMISGNKTYVRKGLNISGVNMPFASVGVFNS